MILLYFLPPSRKRNGVGVFNAYEKSKEIPEVHDFVNYLVNWVAGSKLIFIALLAIIVITGDNRTKLYSAIALIISISTFFWRLHPLIKSMDEQNQVSPKGYSKTLAIKITSFILVFSVSLIDYYLFSIK